MKASMPCNQIIPRAEVEMVNVSQNNGRANGRKIIGSNGFYGANRANRHENGRADRAVGAMQNASAGPAVPVFNKKCFFYHARKLYLWGKLRKRLFGKLVKNARATYFHIFFGKRTFLYFDITGG